MKEATALPKLFFFFCCLFYWSACNKDTTSDVQQKKNSPPVADAGANQVLLLPTDSVQLKGTGTDADGHIVSYLWSIKGYQSLRGRYVYEKYQTPVVTLYGLEEGTYWCLLTVTDNGGLQNHAEKVVQVVSPGCPCYPAPCDAFGDPCNPWDY